MKGRRVAAIAAGAFILWWIIENPAGAAQVVHDIVAFFQHAARGLQQFFTAVSRLPARIVIPGKAGDAITERK